MARQIGLRDIHFAKLLTDTNSGATYDTPVSLAGALNAKVSRKTNSDPVYADDGLDEIISNFNSVEVEIEVASLTLEARALLQGSSMVKGTIIETSEDVAPEGALLFRSKKSNGKFRYVALLKGKFELADDEYATIEDKAKTQSVKIKGTFYPRIYDTNYQFVADEDATGVVQATLDAWFTAVPVEPTLP